MAFKLFDPTTWGGTTLKRPLLQQRDAFDVPTPLADFPEKVFIEKEGEHYVVSDVEPEKLETRLNELIFGTYSNRNFIELFYSLPEVFAPVNEIARRVSDAVWELRKEWNDEVDYNDEDFNRLFSKANPYMAFKDMIYSAVCYEILTGKALFYFNKVEVFETVAQNTESWFALPSHQVRANVKKNVDPYTITDLSDIILNWKMPVNGKEKVFLTEDVLPVLHLNLRKGLYINDTRSLLTGAEKAIKNLIPVYEARGVIYIKRGAMGFLVSAKKDADGTRALTPTEKKNLRKDAEEDYGLQLGKSTVGITDQPVDFIKTSMSIAEMEPFEETLADATAIYKVLRVPTHLVPRNDNSTFDNANTDMKIFYSDVIQPWVDRYGQIFTEYYQFTRRYITGQFNHIPYLQEDKKQKADADKVHGDIWLQRWENGICSLNDWIVSHNGTKGAGSIYEKKLFELTPEELAIAKEVLTLRSSKAPTNDNNNGTNNGSKKEDTTGKNKGVKS